MSRLKHHLASSRRDVEPCLQAPKELRLDMQAHLREAKKEKSLKKRQKELLQEQLRSKGREHMQEDSEEEEAYGFDGMDRLEREQLRATMRESRQSAQVDEARRRFSVSGPPTGIGGMGSQYHLGGGSSSQPTLGRSGTYREPIEVEIERARYEKEKTTERWRSAGPKEYRKEGAKQKRIKDMFRKKGEEEVGQGVCQWMVHAGIPFFATESPFF